MDDKRPALSVKAVAQLLDVSEQVIRNEIIRGNLRGKLVGNMYRVRQADFDEYMGGTGVAAAVEETFGEYEGRPGEFGDE